MPKASGETIMSGYVSERTHGKGLMVSTRLSVPASLIVIVLVALVERWYVMPNANVAWLLTVAERMIDGQRIYVDTIETNPPFSIWLYLPAVWIGRLLRLRPEYVSDALVFVGTALSIYST